MNKEILKILGTLGFKEELKLIEQEKCPICEGNIIEFKDELSKKEFKLSGMCQDCQDKIFEQEK